MAAFTDVNTAMTLLQNEKVMRGTAGNGRFWLTRGLQWGHS